MLILGSLPDLEAAASYPGLFAFFAHVRRHSGRKWFLTVTYRQLSGSYK